MQIRSFSEDDFDAIHVAFLEAFGDYAVPIQLTPAQLREMVTRRGWDPGASVGVFDDGRLVAFTLNGLGTWQGIPAGYDTGTGVVPSHRSRGLSRTMLDESCALLRGLGVGQYLLEVLQSNARAFAIYRRSGFEVRRELQCWSFEADGDSGHERVLRQESVDWEAVRGFFDVEPSWQNSIDSVLRARAERVVLTVRSGLELEGCAVVFRESGDVPFAGVSRSARGRGIGRTLLGAAAREAVRPLRILNVDPRDAGIEAFLERCGAARTVRQWEMVRGL